MRKSLRGVTFEHIRYDSAVMDEIYKSDNIAAFLQYDQRFWDRLSVSAGVRAEYYRVNNHHREAETKIFGTKVPFRPVFRAGLNYQLADYSFIRASFGQGYRNPSINENTCVKISVESVSILTWTSNRKRDLMRN